MKQKQLDGLSASTLLLLVSGISLAVFSAVLYYQQIYMSPKQVFWGTVEGSLNTFGIVRDASQDNNKQTVELAFYPEFRSRSTITFSSDDGSNKEYISKTVSGKNQDYAVYDSFPDLPEINGVWTKLSADDMAESSLLADHLTGGSIVFTGRLPKDERQKLVQAMKDEQLYRLDGVVGQREINNQNTKVYAVKVDTGAYNRILAKYLEAIGFKSEAAKVDTTAAGQIIDVQVAINPQSRRLVAAGYPTIDEPSAATYREWGKRIEIGFPGEYISSDEFQKRIEPGIDASKESNGEEAPSTAS